MATDRLDALEQKMHSNGLNNQELTTLKLLRSGENAGLNAPGTIDGFGRVRGDPANNETFYSGGLTEDQAMRVRQGLPAEGDPSEMGGAGRGSSSRNGAPEQAQLIGQLYGPAEPAPTKYIYRDHKDGETYDPKHDIMMEGAEGPGPYKTTFRRKVINPAYQDWTVEQAKKFQTAQGLIGSKQKASSKPPDNDTMKDYVEALKSRRAATTDADRVLYDEKIAAYQRAYPQLASGTGGGEANGNDLEQALIASGKTPEQARAIVGQQVRERQGLVGMPPPAPGNAVPARGDATQLTVGSLQGGAPAPIGQQLLKPQAPQQNQGAGLAALVELLSALPSNDT